MDYGSRWKRWCVRALAGSRVAGCGGFIEKILIPTRMNVTMHARKMRSPGRRRQAACATRSRNLPSGDKKANVTEQDSPFSPRYVGMCQDLSVFSFFSARDIWVNVPIQNVRSLTRRHKFEAITNGTILQAWGAWERQSRTKIFAVCRSECVAYDRATSSAVALAQQSS